MTRSCLKFEFKVLSLILKPFCPWVLSDGHTHGRMAIPQARLTAPPQRAYNTHFHSPSTSCWLLRKLRERNKALKWQGHQDGTECCTSQFPLNCHHPALVTHMPETHIHTHTAASCLLLSQDNSSLSLFVCQPNRQTQTLKNGSTLLRSGEASCFAQSSVKTLTMRKNERSNDRFQCNKLHVEFLVSGGTQLSPKVINYILHSLLSLGF